MQLRPRLSILPVMSIGGRLNQSAQINGLLKSWREGDLQSRDRLIAAFYNDLARVAAIQLRAERNTSLSSGDLVNDAVLRLIKAGAITINDRSHFLALASRLMRNILIDHVRAKRRDKREHFRVELTTQVDGELRHDLLSLETALLRLGVIDMGLAQLVEMRYFGGMALADIASIEGVSEATVKRRWITARAWLADAIRNPLRDA